MLPLGYLQCSHAELDILFCLVQFFTYIDRSNLSFAAFQFKTDVHLSNSAYGLGASIFFVGYTVSQVCCAWRPACICCCI